MLKKISRKKFDIRKYNDSAKPRTGQGSGGMIKSIYYAAPFCSPGIIDGRYIVNNNTPADNEDNNVLPFIGDSPMNYYANQPGAIQQNNNKL